MKFLYSDSLDYVDPAYDFALDRYAAGRRAHADDDFPHEHLNVAPYDGLLISRAIVGDWRRGGKYSHAQCLRFSREGARAFLRYPLKTFPRSVVMGDCGAFSYSKMATPPYTVADTLEFYQDGGFTHGCSVDHVIFEFRDGHTKPTADARKRYTITLDNAALFLKQSKALGRGFTPVGVIQGWSATSMAEAAAEMAKMGYNYLAVGGMVPLKTRQILEALETIRSSIPSRVRLHLLGFGKIEDIDKVRPFGIASFDTTSPLRRAFKDARKNYFALDADGKLDYYTAIRIPQAVDNDKLLRRAKRGRLNQERLLKMETTALETIRAYSARRASVSDTVSAAISYGRYALWDERLTDERNERRLADWEEAYATTLTARAWESCDCRICQETGIEVIIFRSSNRNKRRGIHNLHVFYSSLKAR